VCSSDLTITLPNTETKTRITVLITTTTEEEASKTETKIPIGMEITKEINSQYCRSAHMDMTSKPAT
jgi:ribosomal protein L1